MENEKDKDGLGERLEKFFERIIKLCRRIPKNCLTERIIKQLIGCGGSVPANYYEGHFGLSKKDSLKSFGISRKEARETAVWLRGLKIASGLQDKEFDDLIQESREIIFILTSIIEKIRGK